MRNYELSLLLRPNLQEEEAQHTLSQIAGFLQEVEALIQNQNLMGKRNLPAPIQKQKEAYLAHIIATVPPEKVAQLEKKLKENKEILRFLVTIKRHRAVKTKAPRIRKTQKALSKETSSEQKVELADIDKKIDEMIDKQA